VAGVIEDVKLNDADVETVFAGGFDVSVVSGGLLLPNAGNGRKSAARRRSRTSCPRRTCDRRAAWERGDTGARARPPTSRGHLPQRRGDNSGGASHPCEPRSIGRSAYWSGRSVLRGREGPHRTGRAAPHAKGLRPAAAGRTVRVPSCARTRLRGTTGGEGDVQNKALGKRHARLERAVKQTH